jgi:DNA-binding response OmpR family regulator
MIVDMSSRNEELDVTKRTALIVEDNPQLQKSMSRQLRRMDFRVLSASNYRVAAFHLATREPNFACVDVQLPCRSGYQLCEYIRGALGFLMLPILMTSDCGTPTDMAYAEDAGANAFLCKPFSMRELADCIRSLLNKFGCGATPTHQLQLLPGTPGSVRHAADRSGEHPRLSASVGA